MSDEAVDELYRRRDGLADVQLVPLSEGAPLGNQNAAGPHKGGGGGVESNEPKAPAGEIYKDAKRTLTVKNGVVTITRADGLSKMINLATAMKEPLPSAVASQIRNTLNEDPGNSRYPKAPDPALGMKVRELEAKYPRAALYLQAQRQAAYTHWADNTGKGDAAQKTMEYLKTGGSIEDAQKMIGARREVDVLGL
jgi:hypothetical protein